MAYVIQDPILGVQPIANTSTTQNHPLGMIVVATDPTYGQGEFVYLTGVASTAVGDWVSYNTTQGATVRWAGTANEGRPLAVAMSANVANQYGWYQISGMAVANISGTVAAGDKVYWQATATTSSSAVAGKQVLGAIAGGANGTPATGQAVICIDRPHSQGQIT
jgi:hypothetical protein